MAQKSTVCFEKEEKKSTQNWVIIVLENLDGKQLNQRKAYRRGHNCSTRW